MHKRKKDKDFDFNIGNFSIFKAIFKGKSARCTRGEIEVKAPAN